MTEAKPFDLEEFSPHVGSEFTIHTESGDVKVTLVEATEVGTSPGQYSLLFLDSNATVQSHLPQSIYSLTHEQLGDREMFLVPVGPGSSGPGILYEACFTRLD